MTMPYVVVARWKDDPAIPVQQVYGPFSTRKWAKKFLRTFDKSWVGIIFPLHTPEQE